MARQVKYPARDMLVKYYNYTARPLVCDSSFEVTISNKLYNNKTVVHLATSGVQKRFIFQYQIWSSSFEWYPLQARHKQTELEPRVYPFTTPGCCTD